MQRTTSLSWISMGSWQSNKELLSSPSATASRTSFVLPETGKGTCKQPRKKACMRRRDQRLDSRCCQRSILYVVDRNGDTEAESVLEISYLKSDTLCGTCRSAPFDNFDLAPQRHDRSAACLRVKSAPRLFHFPFASNNKISIN